MSPLSSADPRTRLVVVMVLTSLALILTHPAWLAVILLLALLLAGLSGAGLGRVLGQARKFLGLFVGLLVIQSLFTTSGDPVVTVGSTTLVTTGGLLRGSSVILRLMILMSGGGLLLSLDPMKFVLGLVKLRLPYEIAYMVLLGLRFLPVLGQEIRDSLLAIQLRGVRLKEIPIRERLGVYTALFLPVVAGAMIRARKTATAMEARAFRAYDRRTYLEELVLSPADWIIMGSAVGGGAALLALYIIWG